MAPILPQMSNNPLKSLLAFIVIAFVSLSTAAQTLPLPSVPAELTRPADRAAFIASHFWDGMDWSNDSLLNSEKFMGESMATFGTLLGIADESEREGIVENLVGQASEYSAAVNSLADYAYSYFYHPDSPYYNEETYCLFAAPLLNAQNLSEMNREKISLFAAQIQKNRLGSEANDFDYIDDKGESRRLSTTAEKSDYRLLLFYDPDCRDCEEAIEVLKNSETLSREVKSGRFSVMLINPFGQSAPGPAIRKSGLPRDWTVGYSPDGEIDEEEIYVIRKTPSIYLLDKQGKVLEKDMTLPRLKDLCVLSFRGSSIAALF